MLGKLMKHEFRATGRIGLPLCGVMLALSVVAGITLRFWDGKENSGWWETAIPIVMMLYSISIFAVAIGIFILLMQHYKRNLLEDEGYLMRTLPVSTHQLLLSKLFVALLWYVASAVLIGLSFLAVGAVSGMLPEIRATDGWNVLRRFLAELDAGFVISAVLMMLGGMTLFTLLFYADFTLSQTFSKHKPLYNIVFVVIFILLLRAFLAFNGVLGLEVYRTAHGGSMTVTGPGEPVDVFIRRDVGIELIELYLFNVGLYFLTWAVLKFRPNLE